MQTSFTPAQLADPDIAEADQILRACVHCGFCTATCPTYVLLGDELDSPRGRIYLIKDTLEKSRPATKEFVTHIDRCLSCLSCMTTCPSGVHYMHLVDHARVHIENTYERPWLDRTLRNMLAKVMPYPARFRTMLLAKLADMLGELGTKGGRSVLDIIALTEEIQGGVRAKAQEDFKAIGVTLKTFGIESIKPSEKSAEELRAMGMLDMATYTQL